MDRRRIEFPGAFYHVFQRGNNREKIFFQEADKKYYLNLLTELKEQYLFKLLGYVLMDNHYHLLIQGGEDPLHKIMFRQNMLYSRYFNKTHERTGHLYGDRYKAILILEEKYLFAVLRYIHLNPVRAGICKTPVEYNWSSDKYYRSNYQEMVDVDFLLNTLSPSREKAVSEYARLMRIEDEVNYSSFKYIGENSLEFFSEKAYQEDKLEGRKGFQDLDDILKSTGVSPSNYKLIKGGSRQRHLIVYKAAYIAQAVKQGYTYKEIGTNIGISSSAVGKYFRHCVAFY